MMKKILLVLLFVVSVFAGENESIKHIELTKDQGSSWLYDKKSYSIRDQVLRGVKIKQKKEKLILKFLCDVKQLITNKEAKKLSIKPYSITALEVSTNERVLLDVRLKNLYKEGLGFISLELAKHQNEKDLTIQFTDNYNHTTLYHIDISNYPSNAIGNVKKDIEIVDYGNLYPKAWKATDIATAVKEIFGKKMEAKVREQYINLNKDTNLYQDQQGTHIKVKNSEDSSALYIFSTTTKSDTVLSIMVHIPDKDVKLKSLTSSFNIPSWKDGEILVIGKDKKGKLHMSQLLYIKSLVGHGNTEGPGTFEVKLDK
jgi:hypothetical protein